MRQTAIENIVERAVREAALAQLARQVGIHAVLAAIAGAINRAEQAANLPLEVAATRRQRYRTQVLAEIVELEKKGRSRGAASIVARVHAADVHDLGEVETLANKFRRWRRAEIRANARLVRKSQTI